MYTLCVQTFKRNKNRNKTTTCIEVNNRLPFKYGSTAFGEVGLTCFFKRANLVSKIN